VTPVRKFLSNGGVWKRKSGVRVWVLLLRVRKSQIFFICKCYYESVTGLSPIYWEKMRVRVCVRACEKSACECVWECWWKRKWKFGREKVKEEKGGGKILDAGMKEPLWKSSSFCKSWYQNQIKKANKERRWTNMELL